MVSGIYEIRNKVNNKFYIGSSIDMDSRFKRHLSELKNNNHGNSYLQRAWNKYGENNFEFNVLEYCGEGRIFEIEQMYIDQYFGVNCYNLRDNVNNLTNVSKQYIENQKETLYDPVLQYNIEGELVGYYKNVMCVDSKLYHNKSTSLTKGVWCKGYKFIRGLEFQHILDRVEAFYGKVYFNCDKPLETKHGKPRKTGVNQICPETGKILNTFKSAKQVQNYFNFYALIITESCKNKNKSYDYYWEYTDRIVNDIKTPIKKHKSRTVSHLHKIKLTKIDTGEETIYNTVTEACRDLGFPDSVRTKFSRVLKGVRASTRGYKVEHVDKNTKI